MLVRSWREHVFGNRFKFAPLPIHLSRVVCERHRHDGQMCSARTGRKPEDGRQRIENKRASVKRLIDLLRVAFLAWSRWFEKKKNKNKNKKKRSSAQLERHVSTPTTTCIVLLSDCHLPSSIKAPPLLCPVPMSGVIML